MVEVEVAAAVAVVEAEAEVAPVEAVEDPAEDVEG